MNKKTFKALELDKIIAGIEDFAYSSKAKNEIRELEPTSNTYLINDKLSELDELTRFIFAFGSIHVEGYKINKDAFERAKKGGVLNTENFLNIARSIRCGRDIKKNISANIEGVESEFDTLDNYAGSIELMPEILKEIERIVIDIDIISDKASKELYDIRRNIKNTNVKIKDKLNSIINTSKDKKYLSEDIVTMRFDRYVIPVRTEFRGNIKGIVHDSSSSGATVFIEPEAVVALNNKLKELEINEQKEIERILSELSFMVAEKADLLITNENIMIYLDVINAKARYAVENECFKPELNEDGEIDLRKAGHLLIPKSKRVRSDITLDREHLALIITGPNTGGKTVSLKTLGLCVLMCQCGLFIPADEGSSLPVFDNVFADIGDEQSIAQSLSTFSAHMTNIIDIIKNADDKTLVLLDELGAGTDPTEGAALAAAILDKLRKLECKIFATTHYSEIKEYALLKKDVMNASVEFDVQTLSPTYRLIIGVPGKSNAFEIAGKLGLEVDVLENARKYLTNENSEFEELVSELTNKVSTLEKEKEESQKIYKQNLARSEEIEKREEKISDSSSKVMMEASLKAKDIISDAKREAREIIEQLNKLKFANVDKESKAKIESGIIDAREKIKTEEELLNAYIPSHEIKKQKTNAPVSTDGLKVGEEVYIPSLDQYATIIGFDKKNNVLIQAGIIKTKIHVSQVEQTRKNEKETEKTVVSFKNEKSKNISPKLDLRGKYSDDAVEEVDKYLDDAYLAGLKTVTIVHGKGTGTLKVVVQRLLKKHDYVKKYRPGGMNEGGDGATIVTLK